MRKQSTLLLAIILFFPSTHAFADIAAIKATALPQETAVLAALDDAQQLEPYSHSWASNWDYPIPKDEVVARLGKDLGFLRIALKNHPDNAELLLLTGLVASYAYNLDVDGSHDIALDSLGKAERLVPADMRAPWFRARLQCQTNELKAGAEGFLAIESGHAWDTLPVAFWFDYSACATIANLPEHALRAVDHLKKLNAGDESKFATVVDIAHKRLIPFDPKKEYEPKEVWVGTNVGDDAIFASTSCGLRVHARGNWTIDQLGLTKGSCVAYFSSGPYKATKGDLRPSLLVMVKQPEGNQTLEDFAKRFSTKGTFEPFTPSKCPSDTCIALKGIQAGMYGKNGDGHGRIVVFERSQPEYPGLIFEAAAEFPKSDGTAGTKYYRPNEMKQRMPGKLFYLVLLDTAASIEVPAMKDFEFFVQNLTVE
jgi:hypothetical protein